MTPAARKSDVFYDGVILTIARSGAQRSKGCRPEIFNPVLGPITHGPDAEIHRTVDLAQPGNTLALPAKLDDGYQSACSGGAIAVAPIACCERLFLVEKAGLQVCPFEQQLVWYILKCLQPKRLLRYDRALLVPRLLACVKQRDVLHRFFVDFLTCGAGCWIRRCYPRLDIRRVGCSVCLVIRQNGTTGRGCKQKQASKLDKDRHRRSRFHNVGRQCRSHL